MERKRSRDVDTGSREGRGGWSLGGCGKGGREEGREGGGDWAAFGGSRLSPPPLPPSLPHPTLAGGARLQQPPP